MAHKWKTVEAGHQVNLHVCTKCELQWRSEAPHWKETFRSVGEKEFTRPPLGIRPPCVDAPKPERRITLAEIGLALEAADRRSGSALAATQSWAVAFWNTLNPQE